MELSLKSIPWQLVKNDELHYPTDWYWRVMVDDKYVLKTFTCRKAARAYLEWCHELPHEVIYNRIASQRYQYAPRK